MHIHIANFLSLFLLFCVSQTIIWILIKKIQLAYIWAWEICFYLITCWALEMYFTKSARFLNTYHLLVDISIFCSDFFLPTSNFCICFIKVMHENMKHRNLVMKGHGNYPLPFLAITSYKTPLAYAPQSWNTFCVYMHISLITTQTRRNETRTQNQS